MDKKIDDSTPRSPFVAKRCVDFDENPASRSRLADM